MSTSEIIEMIELLRGEHFKISPLRTIFPETLRIKFGFLRGKYQFVILSGTVITSLHQRDQIKNVHIVFAHILTTNP